MDQIEKYGHGGDLATAATLFNVDKNELLDFSANINPLGPPIAVVERLHEELRNILHYPDPAHRLFKEKLSEAYSIDPAMITVGNGAAELMALVILGIQPSSVGVIYPCFSEYEQLAKAFDVKVKSIEGKIENHFKPSQIELYELFKETELVFVGNPNNPTGMVYKFDELKEIAEWTLKTNTFLVIDEAFIDFIDVDDQETLLASINKYEKVIIIRSMTKMYAIPGLRLGFSISQPHIAKKMKAKQVTWSVNHLALVAGFMCLDEDDYVNKTLTLIREERTYLKDEIKKQFDWTVIEGAANFLFIRLPLPLTAKNLQYQLGKSGIMIRDCSMYPSLTPQDFRIAVRNRSDNDRLLKHLSEIVL